MQSGASVPIVEQAVSIRILEKDNNRRGDLFGRLMADLFVALGYERPRLNIHKSGRELDLDAEHRLEPRRAVGECKATDEPIGGADLNKFAGTLDAERNGKRPITGYFISLSGFKETAIEQEKLRRRTRIVMLSGPQVVNELVDGRILISRERATELAGRCCAGLNHLVLDPKAELLAHERGWIWAVYYGHGKARTHFVLVHSDGTLLAHPIAEGIILADEQSGGKLRKLTCLNPKPQLGADAEAHADDALAAYRQYLAYECGFIQLDGLPADSDVGSRQLRLESLFVPLCLNLVAEKEEKKIERQSVGTILSQHSRLALLAAPGGGKSTLLKRLTVAYADSSRRSQIPDDLPERDWLPLFFRCRELRALARGSFSELLDVLSQREPVRLHAAAFRVYVDRAFLMGRILLLVDGLDEISDPGDRAAFVCTLRAALQAYPQIAMVVTSREAGFRRIAVHLAPVCTLATLSPFDEGDISRLTVAWHREVLGDVEKVRTDAEQLAATIVRNDRIGRLAVNPLLLTTLLLVKRWVGSLPTRRAVLYGRAVELLLMTWNTEGYEPIPEEEALPQLCYVASAMMLQGVQKINRPRLAALLQESRNSLPTELGYVKGTVDHFIQRVEERSSLLMMTGHDVEDGQLLEFFEFRHLTFQEFLTARAIVEGWHPCRQEGDTVASVLEPHFEDEKWREVIPLAAVLGGKETESLIERLTEWVRRRRKMLVREDASFFALVNSLADEAAARPETIRAALRELIHVGGRFEWGTIVARGRYGSDFRDEARKGFIQRDGEPLGSLVTAVWSQTVNDHNFSSYEQASQRFLEMLNTPTEISHCEGALGIGRLCYTLLRIPRSPQIDGFVKLLVPAGSRIAALASVGTASERVAACYALESLARFGWMPPVDSDLMGQLFKLWRESISGTIRHYAPRALAAQPLGPRGDPVRLAGITRADVKAILKNLDDQSDWGQQAAIFILAWHLRALDDGKIAESTQALVERLPRDYSVRLRELLDRISQKS